jgi:uncharacterized membrane protein
MGSWDMTYGWANGSDWWLLLGGFLIALVVLVGVALVAPALRDGRSEGPTPLDILRERFELGEITDDNFEAARRILSA